MFWLSLHTFPLPSYKFLANQILKSDGYFMTYFHPWEFSSLADRAAELKVPRIVRFNLGKPMIGRLDRLVGMLKKTGAEFVTIREL